MSDDDGIGLFGEDENSVSKEMDDAAANANLDGVEATEEPRRKRRPEMSSKFATEERKRATPHHLDAEQAIIASCIHDETFDTLIKADREGVTINSFYKPAHQVIWSAMLAMHKSEIAIDQVTITQKLNDLKELDAVGGASYLNEVMDRVETQAHAHHYIDIVIEMATRRGLIRASQQMIESVQDAKSLDELEHIVGKMEHHISKMDAVKDLDLRPLTSFERPPKNSDDTLLGKHRYLCKGGGLVLVGSAGIGKSSLSLQSAACWGCGRDFMGITCPRPLRILIINAEDDDGDIGEVWTSIQYGLDLDLAETEMITENVKIIRDKVNTGDRFLRKLPQYIEAHQPDLVVLNPLLSFIGGDISRQEVTSAFLRNGLNKINKDDKFAYILVHHTNKPQQKEGNQAMNWADKMYQMAGSAELANWPRAIITLEPGKDDDMFWLNLAKRGNRAGIMARLGDPNSAEGTYELPTNRLCIRHTRKIIQIEEGRQERMILWERVDECSDEYESNKTSPEKKKAGSNKKHSDDKILSYIMTGMESGRTTAQIRKAAKDDGYEIANQTLHDALYRMKEENILLQKEDGKKWYKH